ncbi:MAG TPA: DUF4845 domain-containing protein [Steroidobacteraceae bacterium]|jgi:hypothetical protein
MRNKQLGVTAIGWLILLTPFAIVGYAGVRMLPLYLNYMKVTRALEQVHSELRATGTGTADAIRAALDKHFEIDMVDYPTTKDFKITRNGGVWTVEASYDDETPLFANISLHVNFHKVVTMGGGD